MTSKIKVTPDTITFGPWEPDEFELFLLPAVLIEKGYRRTSRAYSIVSRIDREDWLDVLAEKMNCSRADFYNRNGSGVGDRWRDHYIRCYSADKLTISPALYQKIPGYT